MDVEARNKEINRLKKRQLDGRRASEYFEMFSRFKAEYDAAYKDRLVAETRNKGEVSEAEVWKLVALDDIEKDLAQAMRAGINAERKIDELVKQAGGGES